MSALEERRQAAREAGQDTLLDLDKAFYGPRAAIENAIEVATRVRVTPEIVAALNVGSIQGAFRAAGFEVIE